MNEVVPGTLASVKVGGGGSISVWKEPFGRSLCFVSDGDVVMVIADTIWRDDLTNVELIFILAKGVIGWVNTFFLSEMR